MNDIERAIREATQKRSELQENLERIFVEAWGLNKGRDDEGYDVGYQAWGMLAVDVAIRLARMFVAIKRNTGTYEVVCDLVYQLNTNEFWQKNAAILIPVLHAALNAHRDAAILLAERTQRDEYSSSDMLIASGRAMPLEVFGIIAYCIDPPLMAASSLRLKHELAPYLTQ